MRRLSLERVLLAAMILDAVIQVDVYLFYQEADAAYGSVGGLNVSITTICLGILYLRWMFEAALRPSSPGRPVRISLPAACYVAAVAVSGIVAQDRKLAFYDFFLLAQAFLVYVYVSNRTRTRDDVVFLVTASSVALLIEAVIVIGVWLVGHDISVGIVRATIEHSRSGGTTGSPVVAGSYLALLLAPAASLALVPVGRRRQTLAVAAVGLGAVALLFTQTRGAWLAFGLSGLILLAATWRRGWVPRWVPTSLAVGALLIAAPSYQLIAGRLGGDDHGSAAARIPLIEMGLRVISRNPVMGVGAGNCHHAVLAEAGQAVFRTDWLYTVHNKYVLVAVETGLVGLAFFLWFLADTLRQGWACWKLGDRLLSPIALALTAAILGHMTHMLVDVFNSRPQVQTLWCSAGIVAAIYHMRKDEKKGTGPICRDQPSVGARPEGASHKLDPSPSSHGEEA